LLELNGLYFCIELHCFMQLIQIADKHNITARADALNLG
jgi:hypothetical protein